MGELLDTLHAASLMLGLLGGLLVAALGVAWAWRAGSKSGAGNAESRLAPELLSARETIAARDAELKDTTTALESARREAAIAETRREEQQRSFEAQIAKLEAAEKRLEETFERTAGKVFEERSKRFTELSNEQLGTLLKPLTQDLGNFRKVVDDTSKEGIRLHAEMREKLKSLEKLNLTLHEDAENLTRALTRDVKAQGNWGEQQLERLLELAGLSKGQDYYTQVSVKGKDGQRLQPDFVLQLPGATSIVLDSKVSLTAWTEYQSALDDEARAECLARHVQSLRNHIDGLYAKNYPQAEELNSLPFVLMFIPIESALIAALQSDPSLAEYALKRNVSLLSPANFLSTARTVASVWQIHKQDTNAKEIAKRGGLLIEKFTGFVDNLQGIGQRLDQAQDLYGKAIRQLSEGPGNLVAQAKMLSDLGAKHSKQLDERLTARALETDPEAAHLHLLEAAESTMLDEEQEADPPEEGDNNDD